MYFRHPQKLSYCDTWLIDGTFKSCPTQFCQLYTIHGVLDSNVPEIDCSVAIPFVYGYLPGKSTEVYKEFFQVISSKTGEEPKVIIADFEMGAISACREVFPAADLNGCLFHFAESIWRRVQDNSDVFLR